MSAPRYLYVGPDDGKELVERVLSKKHGARVEIRSVRTVDDLRGIDPSSFAGIAVHPSECHGTNLNLWERDRIADIMETLHQRFRKVPRVDPWREHENAVAEQIRKETYDQGYAAGYAAALRKEGGA